MTSFTRTVDPYLLKFDVIYSGCRPVPTTTTTMARKVENAPVHKVVMVGSGGVGKSTLTLQFMYAEVSHSWSGPDFVLLIASTHAPIVI